MRTNETSKTCPSNRNPVLEGRTRGAGTSPRPGIGIRQRRSSFSVRWPACRGAPDCHRGWVAVTASGRLADATIIRACVYAHVGVGSIGKPARRFGRAAQPVHLVPKKMKPLLWGGRCGVRGRGTRDTPARKQQAGGGQTQNFRHRA